MISKVLSIYMTVYILWCIFLCHLLTFHFCCRKDPHSYTEPVEGKFLFHDITTHATPPRTSSSLSALRSTTGLC